MARLTARSVEGWKPDPTKRLEIPDSVLTGLYLIVQPAGAKGWAIRYRYRGKPRKMVLGRYPALGLADAREEAAKHLRVIATGGDPAGEKKAEKAAPDTFGTVAGEFDKRHVAKLAPRTQVEYRRALDKVLVPLWRDMPIGELTKRDIVRAMDTIADQRGPVAANRTLAVLQTALNWAVHRDIIAASPAAGIRDNPERPRQRTLDDHELRRVWRSFDALGEPFGPWGKILLLTAQRRDEVSRMRWQDLDLDNALWRLPNTKSDRPHLVPLAPAAIEILRGVTRGEGEFAFSATNGKRPVAGYSKAKTRLDKALATEGEPLADWTWHDLRRTCRTNLSRLGVLPHVAELVLNHAVGGLIKVYDQHDFLPEKRRALDLWADHVLGLLEERAANVVALHAGAS